MDVTIQNTAFLWIFVREELQVEYRFNNFSKHFIVIFSQSELVIQMRCWSVELQKTEQQLKLYKTLLNWFNFFVDFWFCHLFKNVYAISEKLSLQLLNFAEWIWEKFKWG